MWKKKNDKSFRGINMDPLETGRHGELEYQTWSEANIIRIEVHEEEHNIYLSQEICTVDKLWKHNSFLMVVNVFGNDLHGKLNFWELRIK